MTLNRALMREPAGAARLRQLAPLLILLAIAAVLMMPAIIFEFGVAPRSGDQPHRSALTSVLQSR